MSLSPLVCTFVLCPLRASNADSAAWLLLQLYDSLHWPADQPDAADLAEIPQRLGLRLAIGAPANHARSKMLVALQSAEWLCMRAARLQLVQCD